MGQEEKSAYYQALKAAGVEFTKHYREYSTDELQAAYTELVNNGVIQSEPTETVEAPEAPLIDVDGALADEDVPDAGFFGIPADESTPANPEPEPLREPQPTRPAFDPTLAPGPPRPTAVVKEKDPNEMAGARLNTQKPDEPLRTDEHGRIWFQEEVLKPAFPKPRGRRVLSYTETGTKKQTIQAGQFTETFEVAGDAAVAAQVKITLPSYQVGIYKDPRFPFKVHVYNGTQGFDLFEVQEYYGGRELVPADIKKSYVENVLCYDIRTTIRSINAEFRQLQLQGKV